MLRKVERRSTLSKLTTCHAPNMLVLRDRLKVFVSRIFCRLYSCAGRWPIVSTVVVCFSYALIEFSLTQSLYVRWCPLDLARWPNLAHLAEFCTVPEYSFGSLADC